MNWYSYVSNNPVRFIDPTGTLTMAGFKYYQDEITTDENVDSLSNNFDNITGDSTFEKATLYLFLSIIGVYPNAILFDGQTAEKDQEAAIAATKTKQKRNTDTVRVQLQTGKATSASSVKFSNSPLGVSKAQGFESLTELYTQTKSLNPD